MGMNTIKLPDLFHATRLTHLLHEDFDEYVDADVWTKLAADPGASAAVSDGAMGLMTLTTGATDNNEAAIKSTKKNWKFINNKPLVCEIRLQYAEANTDDANVAAGFSSAIGANLLVDDGAGPATTMSGALIFKVDGGTVWRCISSLSTTQTITTSTKTAGGSADQVLRIECRPVSSTVCEVSYFVDGVPLYDAAVTSRNQPIKHNLTYTSAADMHVGAYVKAGSANSEVVNVDYILAAQHRG